MKKKIIPLFLLLCLTLISCEHYPQNYNNNSGNTNKNNNYEKQTEEEKPTETTIDYNSLSEDEYKAQCVEMYNDDFFKSNPKAGTLIKAHIFTSEKYKYTATSMQGILVEDITEKYNLALNYLTCCVMHEETKDDAVPSYFGDHIYMMFIDGAELNIDTYKTGEKLILYGEVIQNKNGVFILPKYIETEPQ